MKQKGFFVLSLDFELYWGIRDKKTIEQYGENVLGAWQVVPRLLDLFQKNNIHATWAVVGAMLCQNKKDLLDNLPKILPQYQEKNLSPYGDFLNEIDSIHPEYIFGNQLFQKVKNSPNQEIGTHTFSHYYCLEKGQNTQTFLSDLQASIAIIEKSGSQPKSFIFPRHQLNEEYISHFQSLGIETFRGTEKAWYHSPSIGSEEGILKRLFRYIDYYFPMGSHHLQNLKEVKFNNLYQIRASRWLRPYSKKLEKFDFLKIKRIKSQMTTAAKKGKIFHLWFHPHDIGCDIDKNFLYLDVIMKHYQFLKIKYGFQSANFQDLKAIYDETYGV